MRRAMATAVAACVAVATQALSVWHDTPVRTEAGFHRMDSLANVDRATIHVRLGADSKDCSQWGIIWNYTDPDNYKKATLKLPSDGVASDVYSSEATVEVTRRVGGAEEQVCSRRFTHEIADGKGMNSLKLVFDGGKAMLYTGASDQTEVSAVPFDSNGGLTAYFCDAPVRVQRLDVRSHAVGGTQMGSFTTVNDLAEHIRASADPMESFWEYLDRSTDPAKASTGGHYTLATVRNGDGYDIVYIKGAEVASGAWRPMQLKGRLTPTIFRDNYDMEWITADMQHMDRDTDAQLSDDKAILTLRFPLLGAQIRFRRLPL